MQNLILPNYSTANRRHNPGSQEVLCHSPLFTPAPLSGSGAPLITVEVHISNGLPGLTMVGLPETTVREARDRVRSAIINSGYAYPAKKITINLAPADLPKKGKI